MNARHRFILPMMIFALGVFLAALGVRAGELPDILQKAIVVCLDCIGLG